MVRSTSTWQHFSDNAAFGNSLAWTIRFGLGFATFLTLFLVPSMYYIDVNSKTWIKEKFTQPAS